MKIVLGVLIVVGIVYIVDHFFIKKKRDLDGTPPDDRYPLW